MKKIRKNEGGFDLTLVQSMFSHKGEEQKAKTLAKRRRGNDFNNFTWKNNNDVNTNVKSRV